MGDHINPARPDEHLWSKRPEALRVTDAFLALGGEPHHIAHVVRSQVSAMMRRIPPAKGETCAEWCKRAVEVWTDDLKAFEAELLGR